MNGTVLSRIDVELYAVILSITVKRGVSQREASRFIAEIINTIEYERYIKEIEPHNGDKYNRKIVFAEYPKSRLSV